MGRLFVYVTNHGFGHLNRTVAVLNRLPIELPVSIRCHPELFPHWDEQLVRPARLEEYPSDTGTVGPAGDSAATDGRATLAAAAEVHNTAMNGVNEEAALLREQGAAAVLCDASWVPLVAARRAGVPGFVLANFLWSEIYEEHARALGPGYREFVDEVRSCYRQATQVFRAEPALPLTEIACRTDVGMVLTPGRDRRAELAQALGIDPRRKLVSIYVGRSGQDALCWDRLASFPEIAFVGYRPAPESVGVVPNLHVVSIAEWNDGDLAASVDAAIAKAGYGSVCAAMSSGTPLIYPPRAGFAEFPVLDAALRSWGGGIPMSERQYREMDLGPLLDRAFRVRPGSAPFLAGGAARVADRLLETCRADGRSA